jgi:hypothetical protein
VTVAVILTARNVEEARMRAAAEGGEGRPGGKEADLGGPSAAGGVAPAAKADDALAKILKMVPGEAAVAYTAGIAIGTQAGDSTAKFLAPVVFVLCAIMIPFLIARDGARLSPPVKPERTQYLFQLLAFFAWAFSIGNPLAGLGVAVPKWIPSVFAIFLPVFGGLFLNRKVDKP